MSRLHHRVPEIQSEVQHLFSEVMLSMRCETGQIVPKRLANPEVVMSDVSHNDTADVKNKELLRALRTCAEAHLRLIDEDERMV